MVNDLATHLMVQLERETWWCNGASAGILFSEFDGLPTVLETECMHNSMQPGLGQFPKYFIHVVLDNSVCTSM